MASSSSSSSTGSNAAAVLHYISPSSNYSSSSSAFASSTSSFTSRSSTFFARSSSPTRVTISGHTSSSSSSASVWFSFDRPISPRRAISVRKQRGNAVSNQKKSCMCSPTTHPGSFRCSLHKGLSNGGGSSNDSNNQSESYQSRSLNFRRSAMTNSLVRIGGVEGDLVRRALAALIRPSSHHQRRRAGFQPRLSRLSLMPNAA